jgi:hypothetical protein
MNTHEYRANGLMISNRCRKSFRRSISSFLPCFALLAVLLASCRFNPDVQGRGSDALQGEWTEQPLPFRDSLLSVTAHTFRFTCDSFYVTLTTAAKVSYYPDSCYKNGKWTEYAKGTYHTSKDTLYLTGTFSQPNFKQKISGCYRIGQYTPVFLIKRHSRSKVELSNLQDHLPLTLNLSRTIVCNPKEL